ncbi:MULTISPECIES: beta strand repeat-containing protein [Flavobacterium]|uniref:Uncharacterized protein n=1 Tax=Flavobacterium keumense TaxID=1306518 RepID=A0ABY8N531_9FLAO|nr:MULTISPECIES: hypothetical protein [Flavobacterium]WGK94750.1 hypothetical protein MG292_00555 [Flavobacterium keumense]
MNMKVYFFLLFLFCSSVYSQRGIAYQAVIMNPDNEELPGRNNVNAFLLDKEICLRFTIYSNGNIDYEEIIKTKTDRYGIVNVIIGSGISTLSGQKIELIDWTVLNKILKVELDISNECLNFIEISSGPFSIVPYSFSSLNSVVSNPLITSGTGTKITYDQKGLVLKGEVATTEDINETPNKFFLLSSEKQKISNLSGVNTGDETDSTIRQKIGIENVIFPSRGALVAKDDISFFSTLPISTSVQSALNLKEDTANKSNDSNLGVSDKLFPTQNAVKTYVDGNVTTLNNAITAEAATARAAELANVTAIGLKEDTANKSNDSNLGASDKLFPTQNAVKTYVDGNVTTLNNAITAEAATARAAELANVTAIGLKEDTANKSNDSNLGASDKLFPTQNAVKTYVDGNVTTLNNAIIAEAATARAAELANVTAIGLKEDTANKSNDSNLGVSDKLFPTQNAVKTYVDGNVTTLNNAITAEAATARAAELANVTAIGLKEDTANKSNDSNLGASDKLFPTQNAVKTYVDGNVTTLNNAIIAEAATARAAELANVTAIGLKEDTANKSNDSNLGASDKLFPTQNAVKTYVDGNVTTLNNAIIAEAATARAAELANVTAIGLKEDTANKSNDSNLGASDKLFPTQNAVKTYVDGNVTTLNNAIIAEAATARAAELANVTAIGLKEDTANKSNDSNLGASDKLFPTQNAVKTYVDGNVTTLNNAIIAEAATARAAELANVTAIGLKEDTANKSNDSNLGASDKLFPTQNAVKVYTDSKVVNGITDAVTTSAPSQNAVFDALDLKLDKAKLGASGGAASLDSSGKVPFSQIPSISFSSVNVVNDESEMLSLTSAVKGSIAIRTDNTKNYVLASSDPTVLSNWVELVTPDSPVKSVNGKLGTVVLSPSDITLGNVDNTSDKNKPISDLTQSALDNKANLNNPTFTGNVTADFFFGDGSNLINIKSATNSTKATNIDGGLDGEILYQIKPSTTSFIPSGSTGQILKSNGTLAPSWVDSNSLSINIPNATDVATGGVKISGDLTGSTFDNLTIANDKIITSKLLDSNVTYSKIQNVSPNRILGNTSSSSTSIQEIELTGSGKVVLNDSPTFINPSLGNATATSIFTSGLTLGYKEVSASTYQVATDDAHYIKFLTSGTSVILPSAVGIPGRRFVFTADLKIVVFQAKSGETIDKLSVFTFANDVINSILVVFSDGANWVIESSKTKN